MIECKVCVAAWLQGGAWCPNCQDNTMSREEYDRTVAALRRRGHLTLGRRRPTA